MTTERLTIDARKERDWLAKAKVLFDAGRLRSVAGLTPADKAEIEELLQYMADRRAKGGPPPGDLTFSLDLGPPGL